MTEFKFWYLLSIGIGIGVFLEGLFYLEEWSLGWYSYGMLIGMVIMIVAGILFKFDGGKDGIENINKTKY